RRLRVHLAPDGRDLPQPRGPRLRARARVLAPRLVRGPTRALALAAGAAASARLFARPRLEPLDRVDAVVALDGDRPRRVRRAVELMVDAVAPTLVVVRCEASAPELLDGTVPWEVVSFEPIPSSTRGEARAVARLAQDRGWRRLAIVTSTYHVTRTRII